MAMMDVDGSSLRADSVRFPLVFLELFWNLRDKWKVFLRTDAFPVAQQVVSNH